LNEQIISHFGEPRNIEGVLGQRIAKRRDQLGLTAEDMSIRLQAKLLQQRYKLRKQMDIIGENYLLIETGSIRIPSSIFVEICSIIDIRIDELCSGLNEEPSITEETPNLSDTESLNDENILIRVLNDIPSLSPEALKLVSNLVAHCINKSA